MAHPIRVEADRRAPQPIPPPGSSPSMRRGQKVSQERGSHTRSKKGRVNARTKAGDSPIGLKAMRFHARRALAQRFGRRRS